MQNNKKIKTTTKQDYNYFEINYKRIKDIKYLKINYIKICKYLIIILAKIISKLYNVI